MFHDRENVKIIPKATILITIVFWRSSRYFKATTHNYLNCVSHIFLLGASGVNLCVVFYSCTDDSSRA